MPEDTYTAVWQLPYLPGEIKTVGYDKNGNICATDVQKSFGGSAKMVLTSVNPTMKANGTDLTYIEITTVDNCGNYVANSRSRVDVSVTGCGRYVGLDNGDSTDYDQYKGTSRRLFSGKLVAIVASTFQCGEVKITVTSPSLETATLTLETTESSIIPGTSVTTHTENTKSANHTSTEIPVRKIALKTDDERVLTAYNKMVSVTTTVLPENATYKSMEWIAVTNTGIETNIVSIKADGNNAAVTAVGDGNFRLRAFARNRKDNPEVISELEFSINGIGMAIIDPLQIPACKPLQPIRNNVFIEFAYLDFTHGTSNITYVENRITQVIPFMYILSVKTV